IILPATRGFVAEPPMICACATPRRCRDDVIVARSYGCCNASERNKTQWNGTKRIDSYERKQYHRHRA
ncbi:MAG: hypothetical protein WCG26_08825, partial [Chloroflexales bacterium]